MITVAVISDTHLPRGARRLPATCLARLRAADLILHAGDIVSAGVLDDLRELGPPLEAVHGNVDEAALQRALPATRVVDVDGARIGLVHVPGPRSGRAERLGRLFPACDAVVYGHTHEPRVERVGSRWLLNPGSPTERRRAPAHTMLVLEVAAARIEPTLVALT
ncbi:MAG: metallophosphoesterase family protein [Actinobacteria bacterium]|nr:metallophosphoesterase family protein [Actinomycetota bacterium]